jgi:hypothetical protein
MSYVARGIGAAGVAVWLGAAAAAPNDVSLLPTALGVTEAYLSDPRSGLALQGFDPTSYLLDGKPDLGLPEQEAVWSGLAWRFQNGANRAAFLRDPEAFLPRLGGYDAEAASRGLLVRSDPRLWIRRSGRIYLFRDGSARERFERRPEGAEQAEDGWRALRAGLVQD